MPGPTPDGLLDSLAHPRREEIERLRAALLGIDPELGESVKWNAPSYGYDGEHRLTMRLQPGARVELVLHRGAAKSTAAPPSIDDRGVVRWLAPDRGVVEFADAADMEARLPDVVAVAREWLAATR